MNSLTDNYREVDSPVNRNSLLSRVLFECLFTYTFWIIANQLVIHFENLISLTIAYFFVLACSINFTFLILMIFFKKSGRYFPIFAKFSICKYAPGPFQKKAMGSIWLLTLFLFHILNLVGTPTKIIGNSMLPSLENGQWVFVKKWPTSQIFPELGFPFFRSGQTILTEYPDLKQGQIVLFRLPQLKNAGNTYFVKRVVAKQGEKYRFESNQLFINNKLLNEPWLRIGINTNPTSKMVQIDNLPEDYSKLGNFALHSAHFGIGVSGTVPGYTVLVLGDNRMDSLDSRSFGFLPMAYIEGFID